MLRNTILFLLLLSLFIPLIGCSHYEREGGYQWEEGGDYPQRKHKGSGSSEKRSEIPPEYYEDEDEWEDYLNVMENEGNEEEEDIDWGEGWSDQEL
jgi:hypothetical protein